MPRKPRPNPAWFKKGDDVRRHIFTREECQKGWYATWLLIQLERNELAVWFARRIAGTTTTRAKQRYRQRRRQGQVAFAR